MGVPGFFAWILKNFRKNNIINPSIQREVDFLYLDSNCLFHPQCHKILNYYAGDDTIDTNTLEERMIKRVINYINYLINFVNPKQGVFISVDGVAPMAKINQQRKRRFKSMQDAKLYNSIKEKHGISINEKWNNTTITPGTVFMEQLHQAIIHYCKSKKDVNITYSSYHTPGEGEHKILQEIKKQDDCVSVIYGLDADLFFLAMASHKKDIYLLREECIFGKKNDDNLDLIVDIVTDVVEDLCFVSVDETILLVNEHFKRFVQSDVKSFSDDFIFICFLLGNDFLPHIPSLDIKNNGLDIIVDAYCRIHGERMETIISFEAGKVQVNTDFLNDILKYLAEKEDEYFKVSLPNYKKMVAKKRCYGTSAYDIEVWNLDNMRSFDVCDPIRLGEGDTIEYKFRYYEYYYNSVEYQQNLIEKLSREYLTGIIWVTRYYFEHCRSWDWQYVYSHAPFISDIAEYSKKMNINNMTFTDSYHTTPFAQLLSVLPPTCSYLLPNKLGKLMSDYNSPIAELYPIDFSLDMINKDCYWKCIPMIPITDIKVVDDIVARCGFTKNEKIRNKIEDNLYFLKN